jgi:ABC-type polysaccharide/polyol phosphate export permease
MTKFVQSFRNTLFDGTHPSLSHLAYIAGCSIASLIVGAAVFKRFNTRLAEEA